MGQRLILSEEEKRNIQEMYGLINEQLKDNHIELHPVDEKSVNQAIYDMLHGSGDFDMSHDGHSVSDSINHALHGGDPHNIPVLHAHIGPDNHLDLELSHLGKKHNVTVGLEGTYPSLSHGDGHDDHHDEIALGTPHINIGGTVKIPINRKK